MYSRILLVPFLLIAPALAQDPPPKREQTPASVREGYALIRAGKITEALAHFRRLEKEMPGNEWSKKALRPLLQAVQLEKIVAKKQHPKWQGAADWLHRFYTSNRVPTRLLALDERAFARFPKSAEWGRRLAETLTAQKRMEDALAIWQKLIAAHPAPAHVASAAVLAAKLEKPERARELLAKFPADCPDPAACYDAARAHALLKDVPRAGALLIRAMQQSPPSQIAARKRQAMHDGDLDALTGSEPLATALAAESKVKEPTKVPTGCEGCPSKGSCGDEQKKDCDGK